VLAIACNQPVQATQPVRLRPDDIAAGLGELAWERRSCGAGSKGERFYDWAWVHDHSSDDGGVHSLLIRRASDGELAFYRCWTPRPVPVATLIAVAGRRWSIEEAFQAAKTHIGLDHYQCRGWIAWHRFILLAMFALVITVACQQPDHVDPRHDILIALTIGELRRLAASIAPVTSAPATAIRWSLWRRRHQATARRTTTNAATPPPARAPGYEPGGTTPVRGTQSGRGAAESTRFVGTEPGLSLCRRRLTARTMIATSACSRGQIGDVSCPPVMITMPRSIDRRGPSTH
jgi:Transposase DDE domain